MPHLSASLNSSFFNFIIIIFSPLYVKNKIFEKLCICANQMGKSMWDKLKSPFTRSGEFLSFMGLTVFEKFSRDL